MKYMIYLQKDKVLSMFFMLLFLNSHAYPGNVKEVGVLKIKFLGFIRYDIFADTRQTVNAREGLVVLYPANIFSDVRKWN